MSEADSFEDLLDQIGKLLEKIHAGKLKPNAEIPLGLEHQLDDLEKNVGTFCQMNENFISQENVEETEVKKTLSEPLDKLPLREKRLLEKIEKMKNDAETYSREVNFVKKEIQKKEGSHGKKGSFGQQRKKKFKSIGGDQKWIPM